MSSRFKIKDPARRPKRLPRFLGYSLVSVTVAVLAGFFATVHYLNSVRIPPKIAVRSNDPQSLLAEAKRLSWLLNSSAAESLYSQAEKLFHDSGDVTNEAYARVGRLRGQVDNIPFTEVSARLGEELQKDVVKSDARLRLWCLAAKGYTDLDLDHRSAKQAWTEALEIANKLGETQWATRARGELGIIAFLEGDTRRATSLVGGALLSTMKSGDVGGQIRFLEMLGNGFNEVHQQSQALRLFDRAIQLAKASSDIGFPFMAYEGKSEALLAQGRADEARGTLNEALKESRQRHNPGHEAQVMILLGRLEDHDGNTTLAIQYLQEAAEQAQKSGFYRILADSMFALAKLYNSSATPGKAEESLEVAVKASRRVGDRYFLPRDLSALASLKAQLGHVSEADALYRQAEDVVDGLLIDMPAPYWRSGLGAALSDIYLQHFKLTVQRGDVARAFGIIERVRGRGAVAALQAKSPSVKSSPATMQIENEISGIHVLLMRSDNSSQGSELQDKLILLERRLALARYERAVSGREFLNKPVALKAIQAGLRKDERLLEYVLDEPQAFCISISKERALVTPLPKGRKSIEQLTDLYLSNIRGKKPVTELGKQLYSILLAPMTMQPEEPRLIIVPDGKLHLLPFESLTASSGQSLIRSHIISYAPSATVQHMLRTRSPDHLPGRTLLAVGDVRYENEPAVMVASNYAALPHRAIRGLSQLFGGHLDNLPATRDEVLAISKTARPAATVLLGSNATEAAFKAQPLEDFKILHLAVHGVADADFPDRAALVLGRDNDAREDGLLQAREITELHLNAELVTLSACDGANGKLQGEAGISNLEEAFFIAGARSVVASLWGADDTVTTALMERFYTHLAEGQDTASALREAKLDLLQKYGDGTAPLYWAGFVLVGEGASPISFGQR